MDSGELTAKMGGSPQKAGWQGTKEGLVDLGEANGA